MAGAAMAQVVARDESALVYYSPKTDVVLNFNYTVERQENVKKQVSMPSMPRVCWV